MPYSRFSINLSYSQFCVFVSSLDQPYNDWSDRHFTQGFSWREKSVSFRALEEFGDHDVHLFINESIPEVASDCIRAFQVPFKISSGLIEIGSISDTKTIEIAPDSYSLQVEFYEANCDGTKAIVVRLNKGKATFSVLKNDASIIVDEEYDLSGFSAS